MHGLEPPRLAAMRRVTAAWCRVQRKPGGVWRTNNYYSYQIAADLSLHSSGNFRPEMQNLGLKTSISGKFKGKI